MKKGNKKQSNSKVMYIVEYRGKNERYILADDDTRDDSFSWKVGAQFSGGSNSDRFRKIREVYYP